MQLPKFDRPTRYQVQVAGVLDEDWQYWLDSMEVTIVGDKTFLTGEIADQAALYGLILKLRNLGLKLISIQPIERKDDER